MTADAVIAEYDVLAHPPEALQSVVDMAAFVAQVPLATVNIITAASQHQVATVGFDPSVCRREDSMCAAVVEERAPVVMADASLDERFRDNPFVTGELGAVRFYASHPLRTPEGMIIGTLCVFDERPRGLDADQELFLARLADRVVDLLELGRRTRELDAALRRMTALRDELNRSNEHLSALAGEVSHDLAGPLSTVTLSLGQLEEALETLATPEPELARWVDTGLRGTDRMSAMIREFLAFARLGGVRAGVPVDVRDVAVEACLDIGLAADDPRVEMGDLPVVLAEAGQLRVVLQNLLSNALKFSDAGSVVEMWSRREGAGSWRIEVADRGVGISPEDTRRVFEPLVRIEHDTAGTGIGLSTCRRIVRALGGDIGLNPRPGGGAVAWFTLPAAPVADPPEVVD